MRTLPVCALVLTSAVSSPSAQNQRLSHTPPIDYLEGAYDFQVAGGQVAFKLTASSFHESGQLWSVDAQRASDPVALGPCTEYRLSPDGGRIVYRQYDESPVLRTVRCDGTQESIVGGDADRPSLDFAITADSTRVVFRGVTDEGGVMRLFVAPADGSGPAVELSGAILGAGGVQSFLLSPSGECVVYLQRLAGEFYGELYSVPTDRSSPPRRLAMDVLDAGLSNDGSIVAFRRKVGPLLTLFTAPVDGSAAPVQRSATGLTLPVGLFRFAPGDETLHYFAGANLRSADLPSGGERFLLFGLSNFTKVLFTPDGTRAVFSRSVGIETVPCAGGSVVSLWAGSVNAFTLSPDGSWVVFDGDGSLRAVPSDGSALPYVLPGLTGLNASGPRFGEDPLHVYFGAGTDIYSTSLDGSFAPVQLSRTAMTSTFLSYEVLEDGRVVYSHSDENPSIQLWSVAPDGSGRTRLNPPLTTGLRGDVVAFTCDARSRKAWYTTSGGDDLGYALNLWSVRVDDPQRVTWLGSGRSGTLETSPDGKWLMSRSDDAFSLFRIDDESWVYESGFTAEPRFDTDSSLVYAEGRVVRVSLGATLTETTFPDTYIGPWGGPRLSVDPLGRRAVFVQHIDNDDVSRVKLWSVALDGSSPAVLLTPAMAAGGTVGGNGAGYNLQVSFFPTADGARVVYVADQETDDVNELFSVSIDGSQPPIRISGAMVPGGGVLAQGLRGPGFALSPDGVRAVYIADQEVDGRLELYRTEVAGGSVPVRLSQTLVTGGNVSGEAARSPGPHGVLAISVDGLWVVYLADAEVDRMDELYAVPLDGSALPHKLNAPLATNGNVVDFELQESGVVLYRARTGGTIELYSTPIDGSAPPVRLGTGLEWVAGAGSTSRERGFGLSPTGDEVWFFARPGGRDEIGLFLSPLDGSRPAREVSGAMVPDGDATGPDGTPRARFTPDGKRILYLADQEQNGLFELFGTILRRTPREVPEPPR